MKNKKHIGDIIIPYWWDDYFYNNIDERNVKMKQLPMFNFGGVDYIELKNIIENELKKKYEKN